MRRVFGEKRVRALEIFVRAPVLIPVRLNQSCSILHIDSFEKLYIDFSLPFALCPSLSALGCLLLDLSPYPHAVEIRERREPQLRQILPAFISMKRTVEICPGVSNHLYLADL